MGIIKSLRSIQGLLFSVLAVLLLLQSYCSYEVVKDVREQLQAQQPVSEQTTKTYNDVLHNGEKDVLVLTQNGFAYKTDKYGASYYMAVDSRWLPMKNPTVKDIQTYIDTHQWSVTVRTFWLSNKLLTMFFVATGYAIIGGLCIRLFGKTMISYRLSRNTKLLEMKDKGEWLKGEKQFLYKVFFLRVEFGREFPITILLFSVIISYCGYALRATDIQSVALFGWFFLLMALVTLKCEQDMRYDLKEQIKDDTHSEE